MLSKSLILVTIITSFPCGLCAQFSAVEVFIGSNTTNATESSSAIDFVSLTNFRVGANAVYNLDNKWSLNYGLHWSINSYSPDYSDVRWPSQHNGNGDFDPTLPPGVIESSSIEFNSLEVPFLIGYRLIKPHVNFDLRLGLGINYSYSHSQKVIGLSLIDEDFELETDLSDANKLSTFSYSLIGISKDISTKISAGVYGYYNYEIGNTHNGINLIGERKSQYGVLLGLGYNLFN